MIVSAGASAAVEELATSLSTRRTLSISAVTAEDGVMSVSFLPGGTVIGARATLLARCIGVESVRVLWGRLKRQSGAGLRYLTITLAPTGLVTVCSVKVLFSSRSTGIAPPPSPILVGGSRIYLFSTFYVVLRGNQEPDLRCLLAIANLYRTLVGSEPSYVVWGRGCDCETAT